MFGRMLALLATTLLFAAPAADAGAPDNEEPTPGPEFEAVLPQQMLQDLLEAAAPFDRDVKRTVSVLGFNQDMTVSIRLNHPKVAISPSGVRVTMDYALSSASGGLGTSGTIAPRLELKPDEKTGDLVAKMVDATLPSSGAAVSLQDVVDPIHIPATTSGPLEIGSRMVDASTKISRVKLEDGQVRVFGTWLFKPMAKKSTAKR